MKHGSTLFLKLVLILIAALILFGLVRFPLTEGRAANLDLAHIYADPFIIYSYIASMPFFVGLYQALKLLNLIDSGKAFSQAAVIRLKNIKMLSLIMIGFIVTALILIRTNASGNDDPAGPTGLGIVISFVFAVIATAAAVFQKLFQNGVDLKSENDLTV